MTLTGTKTAALAATLAAVAVVGLASGCGEPTPEDQEAFLCMRAYPRLHAVDARIDVDGYCHLVLRNGREVVPSR